MRRLGRFAFQVLLALLSVLLLYGLAAWILGVMSAQPSSQFDSAVTGCQATHKVYVVSNGVHLNVLLPMQSTAMNWRTFLPQTLANSTASMVQIGWGSRVFYTQVPTWGELTPKLAAQALWFDDAVLNVQATEAPEPNRRRVRMIQMCDSELQALSQDLAAQFTSTEPLTDFDHFYTAQGHYTPILTCNEWMRQRLSHRSMPLWSPFDGAVLNHLSQ